MEISLSSFRIRLHTFSLFECISHFVSEYELLLRPCVCVVYVESRKPIHNERERVTCSDPGAYILKQNALFLTAT